MLNQETQSCQLSNESENHTTVFHAKLIMNVCRIP